MTSKGNGNRRSFDSPFASLRVAQDDTSGLLAVVGLEKRGSCSRTNAHLSDDETVAKMGHPVLWLKGSSGLGGVESLGVLRCAQDDGKGKGKSKHKCKGKRRFPSGNDKQRQEWTTFDGYVAM